MMPRDPIYDVAVIGGGPAGMMAAGRAAELGASVVLLEKNPGLGRKLLITGGGRCNVTNASGLPGANTRGGVRTLLSKFEGSDQFLFSAFTQHSVPETLNFFHARNVPTKEENDGRLFPLSNTAKSVWDAVVGYMKEHRVVVRLRSDVERIRFENDGLVYIKVRNVREEVRARRCIVSTGGTSHPETGSTGEGLKWLKSLGHTIVENDFALVPVELSDAWVKKLGGVSLANIKISLLLDGVRKSSVIGKVLFTHFGLSGPSILNLSREIGDLLRYGEVVIQLDLFPKMDEGAVRRQVQGLLFAESNKKIKNVLPPLMPAALVSPVLALAGIDGETACHSVSSEARKKLAATLKQLPLHVKGLLGAEKAIVSSGGVALTEVNFKTMQSRLIPNLYLVGDLLNINRPSGGYSLQLCWTTGFVAGSHAGLKEE